MREAFAAARRQVEKAQEIDVLRPDIGLAAELDVLALVLPGRDGGEAVAASPGAAGHRSSTTGGRVGCHGMPHSGTIQPGPPTFSP